MTNDKTTPQEQIVILRLRYQLTVISHKGGVDYHKGDQKCRLSHQDTAEDLVKLRAWLAEIVEKDESILRACRDYNLQLRLQGNTTKNEW